MSTQHTEHWNIPQAASRPVDSFKRDMARKYRVDAGSINVHNFRPQGNSQSQHAATNENFDLYRGKTVVVEFSISEPTAAPETDAALDGKAWGKWYDGNSRQAPGSLESHMRNDRFNFKFGRDS